MKKALCLVLCIVMLLMIGCGKNSEPNLTDKTVNGEDTPGTEVDPGHANSSGNSGEDTGNTKPVISVIEPKTPEEALQVYLDYWKDSDYEKMYDFLAELPKRKLTKSDFVEKYSDIQQKLSALITVAEVGSPVVNDPIDKNRAVVPYKVTIQTIAGEISYESNAPMLKDDRGVWAIEWSTRMIFPDFEEHDIIAVRTLTGKRGEILDRNGLPIAVNGKMANIGIVPERLPQDATDIKSKVAEILEITVEEIESKLSASYVRPYMFIPIKEIPDEETEKLSQLRTLSGVMIQGSEIRSYPLKEMAAHLSGYVQVVNEDDVKKGYLRDEYVGRTGLELIYEEQLRAVHGYEVYIADSYGYNKKVLARKDAQNGKDIKLTVDVEVQVALYEQLKDDAAVGVAISPKTGEVLALVSTPSFDPNKFVRGLSGAEWNELSNNPDRPLFNRFQATYCPGSIFKPVTAAIALDNDKVTPDTEKNIEGLRWQRHAGWGGYYITRVTECENPVNLEKAFVYSDNIFFAQLALDIGNDVILDGVKKFGFGERLPFDFTLGRSQFSSGERLSSEIQLADSGYGQGEVLVNPVHLATIFASFVNDGDILLPNLQLVEDYQAEVWKQDACTKETADIILDYLKQVVLNPNGTGHEAYIEGLTLAGKTGTGELKGSQGIIGDEIGWFAAMDTDDAELLVLAMVEKVQGRGGSHYVIPKVRNVFEQILKR